MANYEIGTYCETLVNSLVSGKPKDLQNAVFQSTNLLLYDTQNGIFLFIPYQLEGGFPAVKVGQPESVSTRTYSASTGTYSVATNTYVRNRYNMTGFRFDFTYVPSININRKERVGVVTINEKTAETIAARTIETSSTVGGYTQESTGVPPPDIVNGVQFSVYNVSESSTSISGSSYDGYSGVTIVPTIGAGATGATAASWTAIGNAPQNYIRISKSFNSGGVPFTGSSRIALKLRGFSGKNYYLNYNGTNFSVVDLDLGDVSPSDINSYQIEQIDITDSKNTPFRCLGLKLNGSSSTSGDQRLGYITFSQSASPVATINSISVPTFNNGTPFDCDLVMWNGISETGMGKDIILFRHGVTCPNNTSNTFLKLDQSIFNTGLQLPINTALFSLRDYFIDSEPIKSFQYMWYDKGKFGADPTNTLLSNICDWSLNLSGITTSPGFYRVTQLLTAGGSPASGIVLNTTIGLTRGMPVQISQNLGQLATGTNYYIKSVTSSTTIQVSSNKDYVTGGIFNVNNTGAVINAPGSPAINLISQAVPNPSNVYIDITTLAAPKITLAIDGSSFGTPPNAGWMTVRSSTNAGSNVAVVYYAGVSSGFNQFFYINSPSVNTCPDGAGNNAGTSTPYSPTPFDIRGPVTSLAGIPTSAYSLRCVRCSGGRFGPNGTGVCTDAGTAITLSSIIAPMG